MPEPKKELSPLAHLTNYEAEEAVLGGIIIDNEALFEVSHFLKPEHFYREINRWIFDAFWNLAKTKTPIDLITISAELSKRGRLDDVGGDSYLIGLINTVPTSINTVHYGRIIEGLSVRRQLIGAASMVANVASDGDLELEEVINKAEKMIFDISHKRSSTEIKHIRDIASEHMEQIEILNISEKAAGIPTGFVDLDHALSAGGMEKGQLIMIPGDTGMGKTSLLLDIIVNTAGMGYKAALFTLEMTGHQMFQRKVAADSKVMVSKLKNPKKMTEAEWSAYYSALGNLSEFSVYIDDTAFLTPMQLLSKCRRLQTIDGLDIVGVDYLALMGADEKFGNETLRLASISRALKLIAKELNVVLIACAQLNAKAIAARQDKRPQLADLRFSSDPNNDSDVVMFVYRDDYYNPDTSDSPNIGEVIFGKQREGGNPIVYLYWQAQYMSFRNLQRPKPSASMVPMREKERK